MRKTFRSCTYPFGLVEVPRVSMGKKRVETRTGRLWTRTGRFWIVGIFEVGTFPLQQQQEPASRHTRW